MGRGKGEDDCETIYRIYTKSTKKLRYLAEKYDIKLKFGNFSEKENMILKKHVDVFVKTNNITVAEFGQLLISNARFSDSFKNMISSIAFELKHRCFEQISNHLYLYFHPYKYNNFTEADTRTLVELIEKVGRKYKKLDGVLKKSPTRIRNKYIQIIGRQWEVSNSSLMKILKKDPFSMLDVVDDLFKEYNIPVKTINKKIKEIINGKHFLDDKKDLILFCLYVLSYNYPCCLPLNLPYLEKTLDLADLCMHTESTDIQSFFCGLKKDFEKYFSHEDFDMSVELSVDDIFMSAIKQKFCVINSKIFSKFHRLKSSYGVKRYSDLFALTKILFDQFIEEKHTDYCLRIRNDLVDKKNTQKTLKNSH